MSKKDKEDNQWEYRNEASKDKEKAKSHTPSITNQSQTQDSKKHYKGQQGNRLATGVNAIKVVKKKMDKAQNLSHVKFYTCKQKEY